MEDLSKKTALIVDSGLYTHMAEKLAESFGRTLYFSEWRGQFPTSKWARIGQGLDNIERVTDFDEHTGEADIIIFLDIYSAGTQKRLREAGHRVWGNGDAEMLELDRWWLKNYLKARDFPVNEFARLQGIDELIDHVKDSKDVWIKGGPYRGDFESFHFENLWLSMPWLDEMRHTLGPTKETYPFLVESSIPGVEVGFDGFSVDGNFPQIASYGYEAKDAGYLGKVYEGNELPTAIEQVNNAVAPLLRGANARGFLSLELRIGKSKRPFLLDPCLRCGSPPSEAYAELFTNWADVIWAGAAGDMVDLKPAAKYAAQLILKSDWAKDNWLAIDVPKGVRRFVKLHNHCRLEDIDYVVPTGIAQIGGVIGLGDTLEEAIRECHENAEAVKAYELDYAEDAFQDCMEAIEEGTKYGIDW